MQSRFTQKLLSCLLVLSMLFTMLADGLILFAQDGADVQTTETEQTVTEPADALTEEQFSNYLDSAGVPDPELVIRPSGELRTNNFLPWQTVYSEFVFMNVLWPDFSPEDLDAAIAEYHRRNRRFGGA